MKVIKKTFSLIEIFTAMILLLVVLLCMVMILTSTQTVVLGSMDQDSLYSNSHTAFDLITRDLQTSLYDQNNIFFWHKSDTEINFVAVAAEVEDTERSNVVEVKYKLDTSDNFLKRSIFYMGDSEWDFFGDKSISAWNEDDFSKIIPFVTDLKFTCFDKDGNIIASSETALTPYPYSVKIDITIIGEKSFIKWIETGDDTHRINNERKFTKTVYLGDR